MKCDDIEYQRDMAARDADDRQRERLEREAELYADAHCTDDESALWYWLANNADEALRQLAAKVKKASPKANPKANRGLLELMEAAYWLKLFTEKLEELQDAD